MIDSTDCILVLGRRGCGKSFLARRLQAIFPRKIIFDSLSEYSDSDGKIVRNFDEFSNELINMKTVDSGEFTVVYQIDPENHVGSAEFDEILRISYYFGNVQLVIEEVQLYASTHNMSHWLRNCLLTGRHQGLSLMFTSQRPGEVHKTIFSQCKHIFCGSIIDGNDIRYLSNFLGEKAQILSSIHDRKFIYFSDSGITEIQNDSI